MFTFRNVMNFRLKLKAKRGYFGRSPFDKLYEKKGIYVAKKKCNEITLEPICAKPLERNNKIFGFASQRPNPQKEKSLALDTVDRFRVLLNHSLIQ